MSDKDLSINQRIKFLIEEYSQLTQRAFALRIGVSQSAVSSLFSQRENRPGLDMLQKIAVAYPEINLEWLLLGQGNIAKPITDSESATLERLTHNIISEQDIYESKTGVQIRAQAIVPDEYELAKFLEREAELRSRLAYFKHVESGAYEYLIPWDAPTPERLKEVVAQRTETHAELASVMYSRMLMERALHRQAVATNIYRVDGVVDASKTYGGLLTIRLDISAETALNLIKAGHIRAVYIDGEGYRVSEQAVREFLGEA